jgi:DNA polymerase I
MLHDFELVGGDTDGLAFRKKDHSPFSKEEQESLLADLNSRMDALIKWENDGIFNKQIVVKTKNYILVDSENKVKIKGSALKASMKEKALKRFVNEVIDILVKYDDNFIDHIYPLYLRYANEILNLKEINDWCSKHTITKAVLTGQATTQVRVRNALKGRPVQEGDKVYQYVRSNGERALMEDFDGIYDKDTLLGKLYDTLSIFETIINIKEYPDLTLKRNKKLLETLQGVQCQFINISA